MEYYINNCQTIHQILTPNSYDHYRVHYLGYSYLDILLEAEKSCIKWIHRNNNKAISIGGRTNATSVKIREEFYLKLKEENFGGNVKMSYI